MFPPTNEQRRERLVKNRNQCQVFAKAYREQGRIEQAERTERWIACLDEKIAALQPEQEGGGNGTV